MAEPVLRLRTPPAFRTHKVGLVGSESLCDERISFPLRNLIVTWTSPGFSQTGTASESQAGYGHNAYFVGSELISGHGSNNAMAASGYSGAPAPELQNYSMVSIFRHILSSDNHPLIELFHEVRTQLLWIALWYRASPESRSYDGLFALPSRGRPKPASLVRMASWHLLG